MQVLEILSHVNKRVKGRSAVKLPLAQLLDTALSVTSPLVRNFGVIYAEMAFERADALERLHAVHTRLLSAGCKSFVSAGLSQSSADESGPVVPDQLG